VKTTSLLLMASDTESLRVAKDDLTQLKGKQVELQREHRRLTNQKEVKKHLIHLFILFLFVWKTMDFQLLQ